MLWSPNTQLLYPFENQANDYSGNARHGTVFGSGVYATRPNAGRCLYFDGTGDYVKTSSFGLSGMVLVFSTWVRCKQATDAQSLIGDGAASATIGYIWAARSLAVPYRLVWRYADGTTDQLAYANDYFLAPYNDAWLHLCIVCDYSGKRTYFYRNGTLYGSAFVMSGTPVFPSTNRVKYLGSFITTSFLLFDGYLQNVYLGTLATMPAVAALTANANRLMLGMNPIW